MYMYVYMYMYMYMYIYIYIYICICICICIHIYTYTYINVHIPENADPAVLTRFVFKHGDEPVSKRSEKALLLILYIILQ